MNRYLLIMHKWFQESNGWETKTIQANNKREARKEALIWIDEEQTTFNRCDVKVIPLTIEAEIL